jgi:hypothetical protein
VRKLVFGDAALFIPLVINKRGRQTDYEAKAVILAGRRRIVRRNRQEAEKDAADRASFVAALEARSPRATRCWPATLAIARTQSFCTTEPESERRSVMPEIRKSASPSNEAPTAAGLSRSAKPTSANSLVLPVSLVIFDSDSEFSIVSRFDSGNNS